MGIEPDIRKVDAKGRVVLPLKDIKEVFIVKKGKVLFVSEDNNALEEALEKFEETEKIEKLQALKKWFNLMDNVGLTDFTAQKANDTIKRNLSEKYLSFVEGLEND